MNAIKKKSPEKRILHLDMDAFYASVEMLDNPALKGKPVIVGGSVSRGVVCAASYEARKYGVHSALAIAIAKRRCPNGIFLPVRMFRYKEVSQQIFSIFHRYTPLVEPISLDEAFLDVTASEKLKGPAEEITRTIKKEVFAETGLTISAGVAASKLVAKIASDFQKPDGLTIVPPGAEQEFLAPLPIKDLWGVGKSTREALNLLNVETIGDLAGLSLKLLAHKFGKLGIHMYYTSRGIDEREVNPEREIKSVGQEETFEKDLVNKERLLKEILHLAEKVGWRLRKYGLAGKTVTLKIKYHDFKQITRSTSLAAPTDDGRLIFQEAAILLEKTEAGSRPVRLTGVTVSNLSDPDKVEQLTLFSANNRGKKRKQVNKACDNINEKYGANAILPATLLKEEKQTNKKS
jgi:DNA polymerase-4